MADRSRTRLNLIADAPFTGDPWERQDQLPWKESRQAHVAFLIYRDLHADPESDGKPKRIDSGLIRAASDVYASKYDRSPNTTYDRFRKWRLQYRWEERIAAYENMLDAKELAERKRQIVRRTRVHADRMAEAQDILMEPLRVYRERLTEIANGIRKSEFREKRLNPDTGEEEDVYSEEELQAIGRASIKIVMESQKHEREALQVDPPRTSDTKLIERRGVALRRLLDDDEASDRVEAVVFKVIEEERALESG